MVGCIESHRTKSCGYGKIRSKRPDGKWVMTTHHRAVYAEHHGLDIWGDEMRGMHVDHLCRNRACINVDHLELVTHRTNLQRGIRGGGNGNGKLTEADVLNIRRLYATGEWRQADLAERFNVSQPNIGFVVRRKTWNHV